MKRLGRDGGSISAWAEEPDVDHVGHDGPRVDLRVGGGANVMPDGRRMLAGRSPRGRRSRGNGSLNNPHRGSISAWAEEPVWPPASDRARRVDLRVGGGAAL